MLAKKEKSKVKEKKKKKKPTNKMKKIMWKLQQGYYGPQAGVFCSQFSSF